MQIYEGVPLSEDYWVIQSSVHFVYCNYFTIQQSYRFSNNTALVYMWIIQYLHAVFENAVIPKDNKYLKSITMNSVPKYIVFQK